jgi:hypothetical protein
VILQYLNVTDISMKNPFTIQGTDFEVDLSFQHTAEGKAFRTKYDGSKEINFLP